MQTPGAQPRTPTFEVSRTALLALIGVNLIPLVGIVNWGWSVFEIVFLYWCENLIVGLITVLKMLTSSPDISQGEVTVDLPGKGSGNNIRQIKLPAQLVTGKMMLGLKLFLVPFFLVHYGMFCMGHGTFIFSIFGDDSFANSELGSLNELIASPLIIAGGALLLSHLYSFLTNYIGRGEYHRSNPMTLMMSPYKRIVVLHMTIIAGGGLAMFYGSPVGLLVLLIGLKIGMDVRAHRRERQSFGAASAHSRAGDAIISNLAENGLKSRPS